jgi:phage terminase small subunit
VLLRKTLWLQKHWGGNSVAKNPDDKHSLSIVNLPSSAPKPPSNLGPAGANLWHSIMAEYDISDAGGRALLEQVCASYDRAEKLRVEIDRDGEIIRGRSGMREHPGLKIELASRSFICRSLQRLGINLEAVRIAPGRPPGAAWRGRGD